MKSKRVFMVACELMDVSKPHTFAQRPEAPATVKALFVFQKGFRIMLTSLGCGIFSRCLHNSGFKNLNLGKGLSSLIANLT